MGKITVNIAGKEYRIVSDESGEYVNQLAYTLNQQIAETAKSYVGVGNASITTLVALNLTDEPYTIDGIPVSVSAVIRTIPTSLFPDFAYSTR